MDSQLEDFHKNIILKYSQDINNIFMIQDFLILENLEECNKIILEIFNDKEEKITCQSNGSFSILINKKFLLIAKKNELISIFKIIYKFLLSITKNLNTIELFILSNIKELLSLINLVLFFNDNITFYSLKKKILLLLKNKHKDDIKNININEIILNEYNFTCITNKKCRKSAISWDYKYFIFHNFKNDIFNNINNDDFILNLLKNEIDIAGMKQENFCNSNNIYILKDLEKINEINITESRNCHMWAYLRKVYDEVNNEEKVIILLYAFLTLKKCSFDYSAFSFIVNSRKNIPLNKAQIISLIEDMKKVTIIKYDEHKCYINDLDKFFIN